MVELAEITKVQAEADCLKSPSEVTLAIDRLAADITSAIGDQNPVVLCVMRGGLPLTAQLLERFTFPLELDYVHATRYQDQTSGVEDVEWRAFPDTNLENRTVLVVDDILDVGVTMKAILDSPQLAVAKNILSAVLVDKQHDRKVDPDLKADFTGMLIEDRYIFGCGMDYKGYLRNVSGIYAVKGL